MPLLKLELSAHSLCPYSSLFVSTCGQSKANCTIRVLMETTSEDDKSNMAFGSLKIICSLESGGLQSLMQIFSFWVALFLLIQDVDFWLTFLHIFYHSLLDSLYASDALIHVQTMFLITCFGKRLINASKNLYKILCSGIIFFL